MTRRKDTSTTPRPMKDHLLKRARSYWAKNQPLPLDLFYDLLAEGVDVEAAERKYKSEHNI